MSLKGLFEVVDEPYFCQDSLFDNDKESYPFRFNFREIKYFENPIPISELAKLIENGFLYSIKTFERDKNATFRGIRQLTNGEGALLEETFLKYNPKTDFNKVQDYKHKNVRSNLEAKEIISRVSGGDDIIEPKSIRYTLIPVTKLRAGEFIAQYENSLQGYIFYCLRRNLNNVVNDIDVNNFSEALMEVPLLKAQQFRSDILCLYRKPRTTPHFFSIIEAKKDRIISIQDLAQLIGYMKTFSESKAISFNSIEGVYISNSFDPAAVEYLTNRKNVEKENPIRLIEYEVTETGVVKFNRITI